MEVTIKEVLSRRDLKKFVHFPNEFYKGEKYYVPTLEQGDIDTLDSRKNHAFEFCTGRYWLAYDNKGKIVGRIAGIINRNYNEKVGKKIARFGFVDFIDDNDVVDALFDTAENWARSEGLEIINGPLGFLEFDASGVVVEGFDELPTAYGKYNYPYYERQILRRGYVKDTDWVEFRVTVPQEMPEQYSKAFDIVTSRYGVYVDELKSRKDLVNCFDEMADLMNRAYKNIHGYSELSKGQIDDLKKQFTSILKPEFVAVIRNNEGKMIAFGVCAPSMAEAMQKCNGKLFPFGFIHVLHALNHNDVLDTLLIGVDEEYKSKGVTALIFKAIFPAIYKYGIKYIETTRELEDNNSVHNIWNKFEYRLHKRARCYIKKL